MIGPSSTRVHGVRELWFTEPTVQAASDATPTGIFIVNREGVMVFLNDETARMFQYEPGDLVGQSVDMLLPLSQSAAHGTLRRSFLARPERRLMGAGRELAGRRRDGSELPVEIGLNPIEAGGERFVLATVVDLSERRGLELRLRASAAEQSRFETVISDVSAAFVNLPAERVDAAITDALEGIAGALDLDRAVLFLRDEPGDDFFPANRFVRHGDDLTAERVSAKDLFPWFWTQLMRGEDVAYTRVDDIPDEVTRATVRRFGARSGVTVGFSLGGRVSGLVAFAAMRQERVWPEELLARLRLVGRVFANAIARRQADEKLAAAMAEIKRLSERLSVENVYLRQEVGQSAAPSVVVGQSAAIVAVLGQAGQVAPTDSNVLLLGETGTGKELIATQIHHLSARRDRLMVRVNCAAIPEALIESELFGREKGAYTGALTRQAGRFELADRSTLFLDEIGDLAPEVQVKLLRVIEDQRVERLGGSKPIQVDVRIIAATHRNLEEMVANGTFREDLYYRLNVFPIRVPPLRERQEDVPLLVWRFVEEFSKRFGKPISSIGKESMADLQRYAWPGNVRELRNLVERAMIVAQPGRLAIALPSVPRKAAAAPGAKLVDVEMAHITSVLESAGWRVRGAGGAADRLGLKPTTLETRMTKLGIRRPPRG